MFAKLTLFILALGAVACGLLTLRQQRLDAVHDMAVLHGRIAQLDRDLLVVRVQIARAISPGKVEQLAAKLGPVVPMGVDRPTEPVIVTAPPSLPVRAVGPVRAAGPRSNPPAGDGLTLDNRSPR